METFQSQAQTKPLDFHHEDAALKTSLLFFADELLPYFGIQGKVTGIAPTELVHLEVQTLFQDFNLLMDDGSLKHFEFQSSNEGLSGLKRFRSYEALTSYQQKAPVTTYVLFSGRIHNPMAQFSEGINTYRIIPIIMQDRNADDLIHSLQNKLQQQEPITKDELVPLTLSLLMGGDLSLKDRVLAAYNITGMVQTVPRTELQKIEAVIYTMADKFLDSVDLDEIMEDISMTRLGQKLISKGREEGLSNGDQKARAEIARNCIGILSPEMIAKIVGVPLEALRQLLGEETEMTEDAVNTPAQSPAPPHK